MKMFVLTIFMSITSIVLAADCSLNMSPQNGPIIVDQNFSLLISYTKSNAVFKAGERFYLSCPNGTTNPLLTKNGDMMICIGTNNVLHVTSGKVVVFDAIKCRSEQPVHTVKRLKENCENNFTLVEVGVDFEHTFIPVYRVCFDHIRLIPFYAEFTMPNSYRLKYEYNAFIDAGNLYKNVDPGLIYDEFRTRLSSLGIEMGGDYDFFLQGQLVPQGLFLHPLIKYSTYDYANHIFYWRTYSDPSNTDYCVRRAKPNSRIYTGTLGVQLFWNSAREFVEVYLNHDTVPIPKWLWCVFYNSSPETDGMFSIQLNLIHSSVHSNDMARWWSQEICTTNTYYYENVGAYFRGNCTFGNTISPLLNAFVDSKWPGARG